MKQIKLYSFVVVFMSMFMLCGCDTVKTWFGGSSADSGPKVKVETTQGDFILQLDQKNAPLTTANFLKNVESKVYENTLIHEILQQRTILAGGYKPEVGPPESGLFDNEAAADRSNLRGTIAMSHPEDQLQSDSMQFIINTKDNTYLDVQQLAEGQTVHTPETCGYCVFGRVIEGMDILDAMSQVPVMVKNDFEFAPENDVTILKMSVVE